MAGGPHAANVPCMDCLMDGVITQEHTMTRSGNVPSHVLTILRWSLAIVLGVPAIQLVTRTAMGREGSGHHAAFLLALGAAEAVAAALLLFPRFQRLAAWAL